LELAGAAAEWDQARPNQRRFFLTRSASSGSQRYSAIWTGDNLSKFDHIGMSLAMSANLGLSGFPFVGSDVGGFGGNCDGELLARWTQYGSMTPFFRNHACAGTPDQEPWAFGPEVLRICRTYVRLRYRLLPYLYSLFRRAAEDGTPIQQPMIYAFPRDERFINEHRQFMLGEHLLVAPVIERGATRKRIVLPEGKWIDFHTGQALEGGKTVSHPAPLDVMPILVRAGAPLPLWPAAENTEKINRHLLRVECFPGQAAATRLYEDDGETRECENGAFAEIRLATRETDKERVLVRGRTQGAYRVPARKIEAVFVGCERKPKAAFLCDAKGEVKLPFKRGTTSRGEYLVAVPDDEAGFELALRF
jgi:alpha-glucosidase